MTEVGDPEAWGPWTREYDPVGTDADHDPPQLAPEEDD